MLTGVRPRRAGRDPLHVLLECLSALPSGRLTGAALGLVVVVGFGDYLTGPDVSFGVVYLIPVFLSAAAGRRTSTGVAAVAASVWCAIEMQLRLAPYTSALVPAWNFVARFVILGLVAALVSALAARFADERSLSRTDSVTGLPNARAFHDAAGTAIARMRSSGDCLTAAYIDVDDFKSINDSHGHTSGDHILGAVGRAISAVLPGSGMVARMGGDEFAVLLPGIGLDEALDRLAALHAAAAGLTPTVGLSIGAVTFVEAPLSEKHLVDCADRLMYEVKRSGKNTIRGRHAEPIVLRESRPAAPHVGQVHSASVS